MFFCLIFSGLCQAQDLAYRTHLPRLIEPAPEFENILLHLETLSALCLLAGIHGGRQVSRAIHLLSLGVCPGLSGSAPLPGARGDPDRWKRSAPSILNANCCASQNVILTTSLGLNPKVHLLGPMQVKYSISSY